MAPEASGAGAGGQQAEPRPHPFVRRAQYAFVRHSSTVSGVDCGAALEDLTCPTCANKAAAARAPSSCSYAASMQDAPPASAFVDAGAAASGSCPVVKSSSGDALHPLTHMPLAIYDSPSGSPSSSPSQSDSQPSSSSSSSSGGWRRWLSWGSRSSNSSSAAGASQPGSGGGPTGSQLGLSPTEAQALSVQRVQSTIPMAAPPTGAAVPKHQEGVTEAGVWMYPSEQMFYAAMKRKGWDPHAGDMKTVVAIHNSVNERAWREILAWEALHTGGCPEGPRLKKFQGKPNEFSPKARLLNALGFALPFDRHDWIVDRCGHEVRYVIDFYSGPPVPGGPPAAMFLDVRPALDTFGALFDRVYMQLSWVGSMRWMQPMPVPNAQAQGAGAGQAGGAATPA